MLNRFFRIIRKNGIIRILPAVLLLAVSGCGDFFSEKPTEIQAEHILRDLGEITISPDVNNPVPELYTRPPEIRKNKKGVHLFYFTKHHGPEELGKLLKDTLGYENTCNTTTNQLIVTLPNEEEGKLALDYLKRIDVPPLQVRIDCMISEIFADLTMDYETTFDIQNLFGENLTIESFLPGASLRAPERSGFGFKTGVSRKDFDALIDLLESRGYAKTLLNPKVVVANGSTTRIETMERVPVVELDTKGDEIVQGFKYIDVTDLLEVTPKVYADGTIGLKTTAKISSRTIPEGVTQAPIITERSITSGENRIKKGESLVIGGLLENSRVAVVRGVPFLKDVPFLGILFSSKDFEDKSTEIIFILTPSIVTDGADYPEMIEQIRSKHEAPRYHTGVEEVFTDPFGSGAHIEAAEREASQAQFDKLKADLERDEALGQVDKAKRKLREAAEDIVAEKAKTEQAQIEAQKAREDAEKAKAEADKAKEEARWARDELEKAKQRAEQAEKEKSSQADTDQPK